MSSRSEEHFRTLYGAILENAVDCIVTIADDGTVESINPSGLKMFGYDEDEVVGSNVNKLMPPPYRDEHDGYLARYLETGEKRIIGIGRDVVGRRKDGSVFPLSLAVSEMAFGDRRIFAGFVRDITDLTQAQEQLLQAERLAGIGQMITGLAHESRNALQRMQACLEMLVLEVEDRPGALEYVRRIQQAQDTLGQLYEAVRAYAAPIHLEKQRCDLRRLWGAAWADLELKHAARKIALVDGTDGLDLTLEVDPFAFGQVFRNVFDNAIDACVARVEVSGRAHDGDVELTICDDGPGLSAAVRRKIFRPFFTTKTQGTGLGMAIVQRIVEVHGGTVKLGSGPLSGAALVVTLPRSQA